MKKRGVLLRAFFYAACMARTSFRICSLSADYRMETLFIDGVSNALALFRLQLQGIADRVEHIRLIREAGKIGSAGAKGGYAQLRAVWP